MFNIDRIADAGFSPKNLSELFRVLKSKKKLKSIDITGNHLDENTLAELEEIVTHCYELEILNMCRTALMDDLLESFSAAIIGNTTLREIDFSGNRYLTEASSPFFIEMAAQSCLKKIQIDDTPIAYGLDLQLKNLLRIPIDDREIPIMAKTKSAAKSLRNY